MAGKVYNISATSKTDGVWATRLSDSSVVELQEADVNFLTTKRNYYLDAEKGKIRFKKFPGDQVGLYAEIVSGLYTYVDRVDQDSVNESLPKIASQVKSLTTTALDSYLSKLTRY